MAGRLLLLRNLLLSRFHLQNSHPFVAATSSVNLTLHLSFCKASTSAVSDEKEKEKAASHASNDAEWMEKSKDIVKDIGPLIRLAKDILHSGRYMVGEQLTDEDEKAVVEKLLAYHPNYEDKLGCGLESC